MNVNSSKSNLDKKENRDPYSRDTKQTRNKTTQQEPNVSAESNGNSAMRSTTKRQLSKDKENEGSAGRNAKRTKTAKPQQNDASRYSNTRFQSATTKRLLDKDDSDGVEREHKRNRTNEQGQTSIDSLNTRDASHHNQESVQSSSRPARATVRATARATPHVTARVTAHKLTENSRASSSSRQTKRNTLPSFRHASLDPWGRLDAPIPQVEMSFDIAPLDSALNAQSSPANMATQQNSVNPENSEWTNLDNLSEWLAFEDEETSEPSKAVSLTVEEQRIVEKRNAEADDFVAKEKEKDILRAERIKIEEMLRIQHQQEKEEARRLEEEVLRLKEEERAREEEAKKRELEKQRADRRKWWAEQEAKLQNPKSFDEAPLCHQQHLMAEFEREMKEERKLQYRLSQQQRAAAAMAEFKLKMEGERRIRYLHNQQQQAAAETAALQHLQVRYLGNQQQQGATGTAVLQHIQVRYLGNQQQQAATGTAAPQHIQVRYIRNQQQQVAPGTAAHQRRQFIPQRSKLNIRQD